MALIVCKNGHWFNGEKTGPFWPIPCPDCGAESATRQWWQQNPFGTKQIIVMEGSDGSKNTRDS